MRAHRLPTAARRASPPGPGAGRGLGRQATGNVAAISALQKLAPGKTLFSEGHHAEYVFEVIHGVLRLHKLLSDGRRQITGFPSAGRLLGLAHDDLYLYTAEAIAAVTLRRYSRAGFATFVDQVPGFARRLIVMTAIELCAAQDQMLLLGRKAAIEKLASFLLQLAGEDGSGDERAVQIPMTRSDIADHLGLTIETVSRTFTKLKQDGMIALSPPSCVTFLNRGGLETLAAGEGQRLPAG